MIRQLAYVWIAVFYLQACGSNADQEPAPDTTVVTITDTVNEFVPVEDSVAAIEQKIEFNDIPASKAVEERLRYLREKYLVNYREIDDAQNKVYVLDRFTNEKKYKLILQKKIPVKYGSIENIYPVANIRAYVYKDSAQCANALNNWLNCFGNDCSQVKQGEETTIKSTPGYYLVNKTDIVCLDYVLEHQENNWNETEKHLKQLFARKGTIVVKVKARGKLVWE